jgi:glycosyltransferase involved in cell wall biosynthesis
VSPAVAEIYSWHKLDKKKIFVIPDGIDYQYLHNTKQKRTCPSCLASSPYNILYVGRLARQKGVDILISAIGELEFPLKLHVVGWGPERKYLEQLTEELGLRDRVIFHGGVDHDTVIDFLLGSQLFVHPARWPEPLGLTILDAMALGVPVIAADAGGASWAIQGTGLTFQPEDTHDLAGKIRLMHGNPLMATDLAKRAQQRAKEFDLRKTIPRLLEVYSHIIKGTAIRGV